MSNLVQHAERELRLAGLFDSDSDYEGALGPHILEMVKLFAAGGHSGGSAGVTIQVLERLLRFKPLTALTSDPTEWMEVESGLMWQNVRDPFSFSKDGGVTWYSIDDQEGAR